jgi:hypothetical protein
MEPCNICGSSPRPDTGLCDNARAHETLDAALLELEWLITHPVVGGTIDLPRVREALTKRAIANGQSLAEELEPVFFDAARLFELNMDRAARESGTN